MSYKQCLHYDEIFKILSENRDLEDISFEIDDVKIATCVIQKKRVEFANFGLVYLLLKI